MYTSLYFGVSCWIKDTFLLPGSLLAIYRLFQNDGFILIFKPNPYQFTMAKWFGLLFAELAQTWCSKLEIVAKNVNKFIEWISTTNVRNNNNNQNNHLNGKRNEIESHVTMATSYCIWNMDSIIIVITFYAGSWKLFTCIAYTAINTMLWKHESRLHATTNLFGLFLFMNGMDGLQ